ncbi:MAG: TetR family transcriptional regulator C-terminal domain-containing protein [Actinomycetota bacterium]|nr:TetR family transcriptional regulator C-terminal domain-containing protein [Actinomycetota bacterium]
MKKPTVAQRRTEILETTCEVVIERGFAATRIADVAKRLEVSSSLIHYHFDSKEQLLAEAFAHYARKDVAEMEAEVEAAGSSVAQLDRVIQNYVPEGSDDVEWMLWIDGWGEALRNPMMREISQELDHQSAALVERVIRNGVEAGDFVCADPAAAATRLTSVVDGLAVQFAAHSGMMSRDQFIEHVRTLAAWEVGLEPEDLRGSDDAPRTGVSGAPSPATENALRRLVARWCDGATRKDAAALAACLTIDGSFDMGKPVKGRAAVEKTFATALGSMAWVVQLAPNALFEIDEAAGTGTGRVAIHETYQQKKGQPTTLLGVYHDRFQRVDGQWFFAERRFERIHTL